MGMSKGQANVLGVMLLLVMVIALWSMVWMWALPIIEDIKTTLIKSRFSELIVEELIIEDVWVRGSECTIYVYNIGEVKATISAIYVNHILAWKGQITVDVGEGTSITFDLPSDGGKVRILKVVTTRGGEYYWRC